MCVCVYIYICICIYIYIYIRIHIYVYIYVCVCVCMCVYIHIHIYIHTRTLCVNKDHVYSMDDWIRGLSWPHNHVNPTSAPHVYDVAASGACCCPGLKVLCAPK